MQRPIVFWNLDIDLILSSILSAKLIFILIPFSFSLNSSLDIESWYGISIKVIDLTIFSKDLTKARRIAGQIKTGSVCINDINTNYICASLPFGGVGISGIGRVHGPEGLKAFSRVQAVCEDRFGFKKELWWFPVAKRTKKWFNIFLKFWYGW